MSAAAPRRTAPLQSSGSSTPPPPPVPKAGDKIVVTNPNGLQIRSGPGTDNAILGGLRQNQSVTSIAVSGPYPSPNQMQDKQGNWWDLIKTSSGRTGWIEVETAQGAVYATDTSKPANPATASPGRRALTANITGNIRRR